MDIRACKRLDGLAFCKDYVFKNEISCWGFIQVVLTENLLLA